VDDQLLLAVDDAHVAVGVDGGDVPGVHPALGVDGLGGLLRLVAVAAHHHWPAHEELAVAGDTQPDAGERAPDAAETVLAGWPRGAVRRGPRRSRRRERP